MWIMVLWYDKVYDPVSGIQFSNGCHRIVKNIAGDAAEVHIWDIQFIGDVNIYIQFDAVLLGDSCIVVQNSV